MFFLFYRLSSIRLITTEQLISRLAASGITILFMKSLISVQRTILITKKSNTGFIGQDYPRLNSLPGWNQWCCRYIKRHRIAVLQSGSIALYENWGRFQILRRCDFRRSAAGVTSEMRIRNRPRFSINRTESDGHYHDGNRKIKGYRKDIKIGSRVPVGQTTDP